MTRKLKQKLGGMLMASLFFAETLSLSAQAPDRSSFYIWQGFAQEWTYPHETLRWGDAFRSTKCNDRGCSATHEQIGSTLFPDESNFICRYSFCTVEGVKAYRGKHTFKLNGQAGTPISLGVDLNVPADTLLPRQKKYWVLLQGFDLHALNGPRPIQTFSLQAFDGFYEPTTHTIEFALNAEVNAGKSGFFGDSEIDYECTVHYLILCGDDAMFGRAATLQRRYFWDKKIALERDPQPTQLTGDSTSVYEMAVPAFQRVRFELDAPHEYVGSDLYLEPVSYDPKTGRANFLLNLQWRQWRDGMTARKRYKKYARKNDDKSSGVANCLADVTLLQFRRGCLEESYIEGLSRWPGRDDATPGDDVYRSLLDNPTTDCK